LAASVIAAILMLVVRQWSQQHRASRRRLALEKQRLDVAVNNMTQGLLLFDSSQRLVVCNQRYIEMYGLSPDVVKEGCHLRDVIVHRNETGSLQGNIDEHCANVLSDAASGRVAIIQTPDGRSIQTTHKTLTDGGWVEYDPDGPVSAKCRKDQALKGSQ
jgi:PAS domain-containing protein